MRDDSCKNKSNFTKKLDLFITMITEKYIGSIQIDKFSEVLSTEESKTGDCLPNLSAKTKPT